MAVRAAQARHPLLTALVDDNGPQPQLRIDGGGCQPFVDWAADTAPITHTRGAYIDLRCEVGLRVWVRAGTETTRVLVQIHHACCDGLGCLQFLEDLFLCYAVALGGTNEPVPLPELDPARLQKRGHFIATENPHPSLRIALRDISIMAWQWSSIFVVVARPCCCASRAIEQRSLTRASKQGEQSLFDFATCMLDVATVRRLREIASGQRATPQRFVAARHAAVVYCASGTNKTTAKRALAVFVSTCAVSSARKGGRAACR